MKRKSQLIDPNWVNRNQEIVSKYAGKWIAINNEKGIIGYNDSLKELKRVCDAMHIPYIFYSVSRHFGKVRILPIRFKSVTTHNWQPLYPVKLINGKNEINDLFLIDSGADCSLINKDAGELLGFRKQREDRILTANSVGGIIEYIFKMVDCVIDAHNLTIPVAWVQTEDVEDSIIGRDVVFDYFDIEFKQRLEKIIFKKVNKQTSIHL